MKNGYEQPRWEELHSRVTDYDLVLSIRLDRETGKSSTVALSNEGAVELAGSEAYFHPYATAGLEAGADPTNPWDEALDELNSLTPEAKVVALQSLKDIASERKENVSAHLIMNAARRRSEVIGLDRAA